MRDLHGFDRVSIEELNDAPGVFILARYAAKNINKFDCLHIEATENISDAAQSASRGFSGFENTTFILVRYETDPTMRNEALLEAQQFYKSGK